LGRRNDNLDAASERYIDNSRTGLIIDISEFLFDKQKVTTATINQTIGKSVQDLKNASAVLDASTVRVEKLLKEVIAFEIKRTK
jgi:hypothetical protein